MENEYPSNSNAGREGRPRRQAEKAAPAKPEVRQITKNKVTVRKKPLGKKFLEAFRPEDNKGFVEYVVMEQFVPSIKDAIADAATAAIDSALGRDHSRGARSRRRGGYTSYNRMSDPRRGPRDRDDDRRRPVRTSADHQEFILDTRVEAEEVLDAMVEILAKYDVATVRDLKGLCGEPSTHVDVDWGWTDLRGSHVHRVSGGYLIDLPRPEPLD